MAMTFDEAMVEARDNGEQVYRTGWEDTGAILYYEDATFKRLTPFTYNPNITDMLATDWEIVV